jgi:hypothetical protein
MLAVDEALQRPTEWAARALYAARPPLVAKLD